jgi:hypothetical protein
MMKGRLMSPTVVMMRMMMMMMMILMVIPQWCQQKLPTAPSSLRSWIWMLAGAACLRAAVATSTRIARAVIYCHACIADG